MKGMCVVDFECMQYIVTSLNAANLLAVNPEVDSECSGSNLSTICLCIRCRSVE